MIKKTWDLIFVIICMAILISGVKIINLYVLVYICLGVSEIQFQKVPQTDCCPDCGCIIAGSHLIQAKLPQNQIQDNLSKTGAIILYFKSLQLVSKISGILMEFIDLFPCDRC
ncbi:MAG: hypothetical protein CME33_22765 [Gimesia sp.]|nr:hypothetical protein [Gimesia sp.]